MLRLGSGKVQSRCGSGRRLGADQRFRSIIEESFQPNALDKQHYFVICVESQGFMRPNAQSVTDHEAEGRHCGAASRTKTVGSPPLAKRTPASAQAAILSTTARGSPAATAIMMAVFAAIAQAPEGGGRGF